MAHAGTLDTPPHAAARADRAAPAARGRLLRARARPGVVAYLWLSRLVIWLAIALSLFPTLWVLTASFQPGNTFFSHTLIPQGFTWENYRHILREEPFLLWLKNSFVLSSGVATIQSIMAALAGYAFARMRFPGRRQGIAVLMLLQMFPQFMSLAAVFALAVRLKLLDSIPGLIVLLSGGQAFHIWLVKSYIQSIPRELDEAAMVDGATRWQVFRIILLPLLRPMLTVIFLFAFIGVYAEFLLTSALIKSPQSYTVVLGLQRFVQNQFATRWTLFSAGAVLASVPLVVMWMFAQRYVQSGLVRGAIKQ